MTKRIGIFNDVDQTGEWVDENTLGGAPVWGNITGALSAQIDLSNILNEKLASTVFNGLSKITVGTSQPSSPDIGDLWVDTN